MIYMKKEILNVISGIVKIYILIINKKYNYYGVL